MLAAMLRVGMGVMAVEVVPAPGIKFVVFSCACRKKFWAARAVWS